MATPRKVEGDTGFWLTPREEDDGISPKSSTSARGGATRSGGFRLGFGEAAARGDDDGFLLFSALAAALTGEKVAGWCEGDDADKGLSNDARLPAETGLGGVWGRVSFASSFSVPFSDKSGRSPEEEAD